MRRIGLEAALLAVLLAQAAFAQSTARISFAFVYPMAYEHDGTLTATVLRTESTSGTVSVHYQTADDSAKADVNYVAQSGTLTFNDGETSKPIVITIIDNDVWGDTGRQFDLILSSPSPGAELGDIPVQKAQIFEDDPEPTITASNTTWPEGNGTRTVAFTLTLHGKTAKPAIVSFRKIIAPPNVNELNGASIALPTPSVRFEVGETEKSVPLSITGNDTYDGGEKQWHVVTENFNVSLGDIPITLTEDDPVPAVTIADVSIVETNAGMTNAVVTLTATAPVNGSVDFSAADGTATTADHDYVPASGTASFGGAATKTIAIAVYGDPQVEPDETLSINLTNPVRLGLVRSSALVTIVNDDSPVPGAILQFTPPEVTLSPGETVAISAVLAPPRGSETVVTLESTSAAVMTPPSITIGAGGAAMFSVTAMSPGSATLTATPPADSNITVMPVAVTVLELQLDSLTPASGPTSGQMPLLLHGSGFSPDCSILFGDVAAPATFLDLHSLKTITPPHAAGEVDIAVTCGQTSTRLPNAFTYFAPRRRAARR